MLGIREGQPPAATHREFAISEISREIMLLNREWKIAINKEQHPYLLFDVQNDPIWI